MSGPIGTCGGDGAPRYRAKAGSHRPSGTGVVVADVERAGEVGLDRGDCRRDGVVDVHERPATGAGAEHGILAGAQLRGDVAVGVEPGAGPVEEPVAERDAGQRPVRAQRALLDGGQRADSPGNQRRAMFDPRFTLVRQPISRPVVVAAGLRDVSAGARGDRGCVDVVATDGPHRPGRGQSSRASPRGCSCAATR